MGGSAEEARAERGWRIAFAITQRLLKRYKERLIGTASVARRRYVFRVYPYSLVYRLAGDEVTIVAVAHAKRKPGYWIARSG